MENSNQPEQDPQPLLFQETHNEDRLITVEENRYIERICDLFEQFAQRLNEQEEERLADELRLGNQWRELSQMRTEPYNQERRRDFLTLFFVNIPRLMAVVRMMEARLAN